MCPGGHGLIYSNFCYYFFDSLVIMAKRHSSWLAEKKEVPETSDKVTLDDISSSSDPEWDDEGPDYEVGAHNSETPSDSEVSLGDEEEGGIGDNRAPDEFESAIILELPKDSVAMTTDLFAYV